MNLYGEPSRPRKQSTPARRRVPWHRLPFVLWQHYAIAREYGAGRGDALKRMKSVLKFLRRGK